MTFLYIVIGLILIFGFLNGFHDASNSIATVVSTKALSPIGAVMLAAAFNFIAFIFFPFGVAEFIGLDVIDPEIFTLTLIFSAVVAAIIWDLFTWWRGIPSSSSHAILGGLAGAAIAAAGIESAILPGVLKILIFIFVAPVLGMIFSFSISAIVLKFVNKYPHTVVDKYFRRLQLLSSAAYSLGHGGNDAQKSMGLIWIAMVSTNQVLSDADINPWIILSCHGAIAIGTFFGGWRIVRTMGQRITKLRSFEGFSAETAGAMTLFVVNIFGIPVSTTHTITGSIVGVGIINGIHSVKWVVTRKIFLTWLLTIPSSGIIAAIIYFTLSSIL